MIVTFTPTYQFANINGVDCRRWWGVTENGVEVCAWIARVMPLTLDPERLAEFDRSLLETAQPIMEPSNGNPEACDSARRGA